VLAACLTSTADSKKPQPDYGQEEGLVFGGMSEELVKVDRHGAVALITLNRPDARNAMNVAMAQATVDAFASAQDARAIVLTGNGPAFCAGLDLRDLGTDALMSLPGFIAAASQSKVPTIAAVNGAAVTGGFELALACDFMIGTAGARFADTHLRVRVYPGPVLVELPRRVGIARAREMTLTGNFVDAETALRIGILNHIVADDQLIPFALELASAIAEQDPRMVAHVREDWAATAFLPSEESHQRHSQFAARHGYHFATKDTLQANMNAVVERARHQTTEAQ
jgi:enoyl-CoA hydratase